MFDRLYVKRLARPIEELDIRPPGVDIFQPLWILGSLPDSWETLSVSLSVSAPDGTISKEMVSNTILNEALRRESGSADHHSSSGEVLSYDHRKGKKKHIKTNPGKSMTSKKDDQCHYCNKTGYWKSECYAFKRDVANGNVKGDYGEARMCNNGVLKIVEIEDVPVRSRLGKELVLENVRHIPDFRLNLISSGKLDDESYFWRWTMEACSGL
ncbi:hypothetical protein LIER_31879 [Lithospermum erythrorhizon]|uniref:Retrovirus-related Pol polyprotein from transposon TNT 1-94-like beta-barrel domain-containing protein n=1 Tax=Lithospermum erythrorhizon TaxID=34254 RepID=A0AAV3RXK7_LITER